MSKLPTAEEFLKREDLPTDILSGDDINYAMVEFAKLHVEAALKTASGQAFSDSKYAVENSYPLDNIK